jgi:hypothetical protein
MHQSSNHIPFSRFNAAMAARDLEFVRRHRQNFTLGLVDEIRIAELTATEDPAGLEAEVVGCIRRFAAEAVGQRPSDYLQLFTSFQTMAHDQELATGELLALCAARGIE